MINVVIFVKVVICVKLNLNKIVISIMMVIFIMIKLLLKIVIIVIESMVFIMLFNVWLEIVLNEW